MHEDIWLVDEIRSHGGRLVATDAAWVRTSARRIGRAPGGYARCLQEDLVPLAQRLREPHLRQRGDPLPKWDPSEAA
ncbi:MULTISPECIES: hypothetical protein [Microbacterium]|uniref:hypothetical protein n=1 Tax=Microbacterium TaxID=33882 RepID=UPI002859D39B|nr:hypothetical protein [Microbacterium trichothecenolyticum]MDR7183044.1 hypothetical protein [Microbacterium trichothecenolyticum]